MGKKKKTHEEFVEQVYAKVGDEYTVVGQYVDYKTPVDIRHNPCGRIKPKTPARFFSQKNNCKSCNSQKLTQEQFVQKVYEAVGDKFTVVGTYVNNDTPIDIYGLECGHTFPITPYNFLKRKRCSDCYRNVKKTTEQFRQEVYDLVGDEYSVMSDYINSKSIVDMKHNVCGDIYPVVAGSFLQGSRCNDCANKLRNEKQRHTTEQFKQEIYEMYGDEYTILGDYFNTHTPILTRHNPCGHEWTPQPANLKSKNPCPKCNKGLQRTTQQYIDEVYKLLGDEYTVLGDFQGVHKGVSTRHEKCGYEWKPSPANFLLGGKRCPECKESKGEKAIAKWLKKQGVLFERQYRIEECRNERPLPFDFAVHLKDGSFILIEFQGIQHFKPVAYYGGVEGLNYRLKNDAIKRTYCKANKVYLLEIPHWDFKKIDQILANELLLLHLSPSNQQFEQLAFALS